MFLPTTTHTIVIAQIHTSDHSPLLFSQALTTHYEQTANGAAQHDYNKISQLLSLLNWTGV